MYNVKQTTVSVSTGQAVPMLYNGRQCSGIVVSQHHTLAGARKFLVSQQVQGQPFRMVSGPGNLGSITVPAGQLSNVFTILSA